MATKRDAPIEVALDTFREIKPQSNGSEDVMREDPDQQQLFDSIDELDFSQLPPELQSLDVEKLKQIYHEAESISILLTGKTGSGKSTLTNGILGVNVKNVDSAKEGGGVKVCSTKVAKYQTKKGKIDVIVWDSPGLQDGTENQEEYLLQMQQECNERDLTVYCAKISDIRFVSGNDNPDVLAMKKLTKVFGNDFWKTTIIVLTFANTLEAFNVDWDELPKNEKDIAFLAKIQEWNNQIKAILIQDIKVPAEIVEAIRVIPAGHYKKPHLPGCRFWLSNLWFHCVGTISSPVKKTALVRMNVNRFKNEKDVRKDDFTKPPEQQPIVVNKNTVSMLSVSGGITVGSFTGAAVGGTVGLLGIIAGPIGMAVTVPVGILIGAIVGATITGIAIKKTDLSRKKQL